IRSPTMGSWPVAGRPLLFLLEDIDRRIWFVFSINCLHCKGPRLGARYTGTRPKCSPYLHFWPASGEWLVGLLFRCKHERFAAPLEWSVASCVPRRLLLES